jgi:autophagy-related protein 13
VGARDRTVSTASFEGEDRLPPRKRYSSSFGHRYVGSAGSVSTGGADGNGSGSGRSTPASAGGLVPELMRRERTHSAVGVSVFYFVRVLRADFVPQSVTSFLSTTTDDDDISTFVQDIDSRKPLSGRDKQREKDQELRRAADTQTQGGDDALGTKGKERERPREVPTRKGSSTGSSTARAWSGHSIDTDSPSTSGFTPERRRSTSPPKSGLSSSPTSITALASVSPGRGPMLTSQGEVDERLKKMNETFMKSLEGISGSSRRKDRKRAQDDDNEQQQQQPHRRANTVHEPTPTRGGTIAIAGRGLWLGRAHDGDLVHPTRSPSPSSPYSPGRGMGLGRGQDGSLSHSTGSEEVMGRMELYEERRRSGYQS